MLVRLWRIDVAVGLAVELEIDRLLLGYVLEPGRKGGDFFPWRSRTKLRGPLPPAARRNQRVTHEECGPADEG